jgi:hypothetical protein
MATGSQEDLNAVVLRQQKRRDLDGKLSQIRAAFALGEFKRVLDLVKDAESIDRDNPNIKFYKDWANKKIRTGEGPIGAFVNNPRLGQGRSTPNPRIPKPRTARTPVAAVSGSLPDARPTPVVVAVTPATSSSPNIVVPTVPSQTQRTAFFRGYGPVLLAVGVAVAIIVLATLLLSRRTPIPTAPKVQYTPIPILPNMLVPQPSEGQSTLQLPSMDQSQDPQTLAAEYDEPAVANVPPPMADFPFPQGSFGGLGVGSLPNQPPPVQPLPAAPLPEIDALPTANANQDDTMYAIEEEHQGSLQDPLTEPEDQAYGFHEAKTLELTKGANPDESTVVTGSPLPPSVFGESTRGESDPTLPVHGPLPPSRFDSASPPAQLSSLASTTPPPPEPGFSPTAPALSPSAAETISFDFLPTAADVTVPVAGNLPPSRFDLTPPPASLEVSAADVIASISLNLPDDSPAEPPLLPEHIVVAPSVKSTSPSPVPAPPPAPTPVLPPSLPGQDSVIDLGSLGIQFGLPSQPESAVEKEPERKIPKPVHGEPDPEPVIEALAGLGNISLADVPTLPPGSYHPDDVLSATTEMSPYGVDGALAATKTMDDYQVGEDSVYGNASITEAELSSRMFRDELEKGDRAAASADWKKAVHFYAIAASIQSDHPELLEKLRIAREMKRKTDEG